MAANSPALSPNSSVKLCVLRGNHLFRYTGTGTTWNWTEVPANAQIAFPDKGVEAFPRRAGIAVILPTAIPVHLVPRIKAGAVEQALTKLLILLATNQRNWYLALAFALSDPRRHSVKLCAPPWSKLFDLHWQLATDDWPLLHMDQTQIAALLAPFLADSQQPIADNLLPRIATYLDLLLKWNAITNLTSVRTPVEIVARHFGESLFAARHLFPDPTATATLADVGSGAGFPGLPIKLWAPKLYVTLIESHGKKSTFLREVVRALAVADVDVFAGRAEDLAARFQEAPEPATREGNTEPKPAPSGCFDVVTLRAVEQFELVLPVAGSLLQPAGRLALLIGEEQVQPAATLLPTFQWENPRAIPNSRNRVLLIGQSSRESS